MKNLIIALAIIVSISFVSEAKTNPKKSKMAMKEHTCTTDCANGVHAYTHGEKGHSCTTACKPMKSKTAKLRAHVCTDTCKNGVHMYAHGEKGHTCSAVCKNGM